MTQDFISQMASMSFSNVPVVNIPVVNVPVEPINQFSIGMMDGNGNLGCLHFLFIHMHWPFI